MSDNYDCPMCHGEGKITWKIFSDTNAPQRIFAYGIAAGIILLGSSLLYYMTTPPSPRNLMPIELCAKGCGEGRMKQFTDPMPQWTEHTPGTEPNLEHPPLPAKCECVPPEQK
jgi:hypothetical protein